MKKNSMKGIKLVKLLSTVVLQIFRVDSFIIKKIKDIDNLYKVLSSLKLVFKS